VDRVPDPLLLRKLGSAGNQTRTYGSVARNSDHLTTEAVHLTLTKYKLFLYVPCATYALQKYNIELSLCSTTFRAWGEAIFTIQRP
jgi:hypothetical protein